MQQERDDQGRWIPGTSGNPNGRPRFSIISLVRDKLQEQNADGDRTVAKELVDNYIEQVLDSGDGVAIRDLIDRFDGKPTQHIETSNEVDAAWLSFWRDIVNEDTDAEQEAEADITALGTGEAEAPDT